MDPTVLGLLLVGLVLLVVGGELLVRGASQLAIAIGVSLTALLPVIHVANLATVLRTSAALTRQRSADFQIGGARTCTDCGPSAQIRKT